MVAAFLVTDGLIIGLLLELGHALFRMAAVWMVTMLFVMYAALATFVLYLVIRRLLPKQPVSRGLRLFAPIFFLGLTAYAYHNANSTVVRHLDITIDKKMNQPLRVGMASDLHLGVLFGSDKLDELTQIMKREKVDLILLPGDLMDDNVIAYREQHMQPHLAALSAPLGVFATMGNHDLMSDGSEIAAEVQKAGLHLMQNRTEIVNGRVLLVGRNDDLDKQRPDAAQLLVGQNTNLPVILMDHRPTQILENAKLPVDLQLSGHVHKGQIAPANWIVQFLYPLHYGYKRFNNTHVVVTSGYGFWGIPLRLGSQSEVWIINIKGRSSDDKTNEQTDDKLNSQSKK